MVALAVLWRMHGLAKALVAVLGPPWGMDLVILQLLIQQGLER